MGNIVENTVEHNNSINNVGTQKVHQPVVLVHVGEVMCLPPQGGFSMLKR